MFFASKEVSVPYNLYLKLLQYIFKFVPKLSIEFQRYSKLIHLSTELTTDVNLAIFIEKTLNYKLIDKFDDDEQRIVLANIVQTMI